MKECGTPNSDRWIGTSDSIDGYTADRMTIALNGLSLMSLPEIYSQLVGFLRSGEPLPDKFRVALADAIERGQDDAEGVRLKLEAGAGYFKGMTIYQAQRRLIDAGKFIDQERRKGCTFTAIYALLPENFGIVDGPDYGKRARKTYTEFLQFCASDDPDLCRGKSFWGSDGDDFLAFAEQRFAEIRAGFDMEISDDLEISLISDGHP